MLLRPPLEQGHGALEMARNHPRTARERRLRDVQRHGFSYQGRQAGDHLPRRRTGRNVVQIALDDTLDSWSEAIPVIPMGPDGKEADSNNWDPDCWLNNDTYYAISGGGPPQLMKSGDLKNWEFMGKLFHDDTPWEDFGLDPDEDVSCANMFKIGDKWMLLCISHGLGCRYFLGDFKDEKYLPTEHHLMNWREVDFFAPESLLTPDGRRVMWAWMTDGMWEDFSGRQSLPREISLVDGKLLQKPLQELQGLRDDEADEGAVSVAAGERKKLERIAGPATEISAVFEPTDAEAFGLNVFCGDDGDPMRIGYLADEKKLVVGEVKAPFELEDGEVARTDGLPRQGYGRCFCEQPPGCYHRHGGRLQTPRRRSLRRWCRRQGLGQGLEDAVGLRHRCCRGGRDGERTAGR